MAAPTYVTQSIGGTTTTGAFTSVAYTGTIGDLFIIQVLQDGSTAGAIAFTGWALTGKVADLAGTANTITHIGSFPVGSPTAAYQHLWCGRWTVNTGTSVGNFSNSTSEDTYTRVYSFRDVSTGTTLATVIENGTAGSTVNGVGLSATASDSGVTTLGADRMAVNFLAVDDDNACAAFTGQSGGTWAEAVAEFADATGTDGAIQLQIATIASAGTINGGTASITASDNWGVVGFALIGTTAGGPTGTFALTTNPIT